jgi:uncharacterized repeat protein (TIGR01451 family)
MQKLFKLSSKRPFGNKTLKKLSVGLGALVIVVMATMMLQNDTPVAQSQSAPPQATQPTILIQFGDQQTGSPKLPQDCNGQLSPGGSTGADTIWDEDPDCLRVRITNSPDTVYTKDFQFCLVFGFLPGNGWQSCTDWASRSQYGSFGPITKNGSGNLGSYPMGVLINTRTMAEAGLPANATITNIKAGVALFYANSGNGACLGSSGMKYGPVGSGWSSDSYWAFGAQGDDDPGCFQAALSPINNNDPVVNIPPYAEYVSTTIPTVVSEGQTYNYRNIVMRNKGLEWPLAHWTGGAGDNPHVVHVPQECSLNIADYPHPDQDPNFTCDDYQILSSQRFRLERVDTEPIVVTSKELRSRENDIDFKNGNYFYNNPTNIPITKINNRANVATWNTIPFYAKQNLTYKRYAGTNEICTPVGGTPVEPPIGGDNLPPAAQKSENPWTKRLFALFQIKSAQAQADPDEICQFFDYDYIGISYDPVITSIFNGDNATFAPIRFTAPSAPGIYTLKFQMVDLENLNTYSGGWEGGLFPEVANIVLQVGNPSGLNCTATLTRAQGEQAQISVAAFGSSLPPSLSVTMTSSGTPPVPGMTNSPMILNSANSYTGLANVATTGVSPGPYTLTFTASDGAATNYTCNTLLTITGNTSVSNTAELAVYQPPTVDLTINNQSTASIPVGQTATIRWTPTATYSGLYCWAFGENSWTGDKSSTPGSTYSQSVGPFSEGTYYFSIVCYGSLGAATSVETVVLDVYDPGTLDPPINVLARSQPCGQITVTWQRSPNTPHPTEFRVSRNTTGIFNGSEPIFATVANNSNPSYIYEVIDPSPLNPSGLNYYRVVAWLGFESDPVVVFETPDPCAPDVSPSDKDFLSFKRGTSSTVNNQADIPCTGGAGATTGSEVFNLPHNSLFQVGDVLTFRINICNDGNAPLTGITVTDTLTNLTNPTGFRSEQAGCLLSSTVNGNGTITFQTSPVNPPDPGGGPRICDIEFEATIALPSGPSSSMYRFKNSAFIDTTGSAYDKTVATPFYFFTVGAGVPNRNETPPQ